MKLRYFKYYIPWLILFGIMTIIALASILPGKSTHDKILETLYQLGFWIGISSLIGTLLLFYDVRWGPKARKKYLSKSPLVDLKKHGFEIIDNYYVGLYKGYYFLVGYDWRGQNNNGFFFVTGLFKATEKGNLFEYSVFKYLEDKYKIQDIKWDLNIAYIHIYSTIRPPKFKQISMSMDKIVESFKTESLEHLSYDSFKEFRIEDYNINNKNDNPITAKAKSIKPIEKDWYLRNINKIAFVMAIGCLVSIGIFVERLFLDIYAILTPIIIGILVFNFISRNYYKLKLIKTSELIIANIINGAATGFFLFTLINFLWTDKMIQHLTFDKFEFYNEKTDNDIRLHIEDDNFKKTIDITKQDYEYFKGAKTIGVAYETSIMGYKKIRSIYVKQ